MTTRFRQPEVTRCDIPPHFNPDTAPLPCCQRQRQATGRAGV